MRDMRRMIGLSHAEQARRWTLPYGMWTCADGREVLFNREYCPIWQRYPGKPAEKADSDEWVSWVKQQYLFDGREIWGRTKIQIKARAPLEQALTDFLAGAQIHFWLAQKTHNPHYLRDGTPG